jgi:P4 family phage/plasmid primase-like protien
MKASKKVSLVNTHTQKDTKSYSQILELYRIKKGEESKKITNTRIGNSALEIYGGKYYIPDEKYQEFLQFYYREVFLKGQPEYLTETQLEKGPLLVDVDLRHDYSVTTRQYTLDHITELVDQYLAVFKETFQLEDAVCIDIYLFQKPSVNRVAEDEITKDGAHLIFSLACDHITQQIIRKKVIAEMDNVWGTELGLTNTWDKVFDEGISQGPTNWQLVGSRKPGNEAYRLTGIYHATFDESDGEFSVTFSDASTFDMAKDIFKLSARYPHHYEPFMTNACMAEHNEWKEGTSAKSKRTVTAKSSAGSLPEMDPLSIRTKEQLDAYLTQFMDSIPVDRYIEHEAASYTMILPVKYYGQGSYSLWFAVGCALRNISRNLFIVWLAFSAQSDTFSFSEDVMKLWEQWHKFEKTSQGLTLRSLIYWAKKDAPEKFDDVRRNSLDYYIEQSLDNGLTDFAVSDKKGQTGTDWDIANVLFHLKKEQFVCSNIKMNDWFEFKQHRWVNIDSGTSLRVAISTELRSLYGKKAEQLTEALGALENEEDPKYKFLKARIEKTIDIYAKLGRTSEKRNIMDAAKDMFYDSMFARTVDTNPYLLCCSNGVWDFKTGEFRDGKPDDYISMSTRNEYHPNTEKHTEIIKEINDFMMKLFPVEELREYMWSHLASTLVGTAVNQTFNNYLGAGRNGKSVLVTLMTKTLGEYKGELPLTAVVTQRRTAVGGLAPEIAALKGIRYAVMQEPRQGDVLNEGILKEMTSGMDAIQARSLFSTPITFIPQFKLVVCANVLPEIKTNDYGTWRRIRVVPFMSLFTENPVDGDPFKPYQYKLDSTIDEKFDKWKTVFLSLLVERVLKTDGRVVDCNTVLHASNEYKQKQDVIAQFIDERIEKVPGQWLTQTQANQGFKLWHEENFGNKGPQAKELHVYLDKMFGTHEKKKGWRDIRLIFDTDERATEVDDEDALY